MDWQLCAERRTQKIRVPHWDWTQDLPESRHKSDALTIKLLATIVISGLILLTNSHKDCIVQSHGVKWNERVSEK